jgi:inorganic pyrophosphatase
MPDFLSLPTFASPKEIHVVVETPRFARAKFKYARSADYTDAADLDDLPLSMRHRAEEFFAAAITGTAKKLKLLGWRGPRAAWASIRRAQKAFAKAQQQS